MESCAIGQPRPKKRGKKAVDSCPSFSGGDKPKAYRAKIKLEKGGDTPPPVKSQGAHMNVRDIGNEPGQVKPAFEMSAEGQKRSSYKGEEGETMARGAELSFTKRKKKAK